MLNMELARKYARAIFELACEEDKLKEFGEDISKVQRLYTECPELKSYLSNPNFQPEDKKSLLKEVFEGGVHEHVLNFLLLLVDKRRMHVFEAISAIFNELSNEKLGIAVADVTTLRRHRDPSLIGGVVVRIGDRRIDGSIKGRLEAMTAELMAN